MSYKINSHFRHFGCGTGQVTGLNTYYIGLPVPFTTRASSVSGPQDLVKTSARPGSATISPCTVTMDHDAIIFSMTDGLTRGPDQDVHVLSVGSQKYPSYDVDVIYL